MIRGKRWGSRKPRIALAGAVAAIAALSLVGPAQATTTAQQFQFDYGRLKLGGSGTPLDIVDHANATNWLKLQSVFCVDLTGGCTGTNGAVNDFAVTPANFQFQPFTTDVSGVPGETATVDLIPLANVTGNYNFATGAFTTDSGNYESDVTLAGPIAAACKVTPIPLAFSTAKQTPFLGDAFDTAVAVGEPRNGVIDADWATLPTPSGQTPADDSTCSSVLNVFTTGPGGIGLGRDINPVLAATPPPSGGGTVTPPASTPAPTKKKKCKKAKKGSASAAKKCKKKK
jgi:hypothetical protein